MKCGDDKYVTRVRVQVAEPASRGQDDRSIIGLSVVCEHTGGSTEHVERTVPGANGTWGEWSTSRDHQFVKSVSAQEGLNPIGDSEGLIGITIKTCELTRDEDAEADALVDAMESTKLLR